MIIELLLKYGAIDHRVSIVIRYNYTTLYQDYRAPLVCITLLEIMTGNIGRLNKVAHMFEALPIRSKTFLLRKAFNRQ